MERYHVELPIKLQLAFAIVYCTSVILLILNMLGFFCSLPSCNVCKSPLTGYFGKQGYECRGMSFAIGMHKQPFLQNGQRLGGN